MYNYRGTLYYNASMKLISTPLAFPHKHCTTTHIYSAKTYVMLPTSFKLLNDIHQIAEITPQNTLCNPVCQV
jgi:hypothetical protein